MQTIQMPWGEETLSVEVPDTWNVIYPEDVDPSSSMTADVGSEESIVARSLSAPANASALSSRSLAGKKVVIIVDDNTRPTPAHRFMHLVLDELEKAGASRENIVLLPGLGIHTAMTEGEMKEKVGAENLSRVTWENHDAFDPSKNAFFGTTSRGTEVHLNAHLKDAEVVVLVGVVEPHLWAGFGGGMKNILPGVASADTIGSHHVIIAEPPYRFNRVGMAPEENSFRQDLEEVRSMIEAEIFCINVVLNHAGRVIESFAGEVIQCHRNAIDFNIRVSGKKLKGKVDGVIVNSYPMDINFKQSMKCVGNSLPALKEGGAVMGFLRAERGLDDIEAPKDAKPLWLVRAILRLLGPSRVLWFLNKVKKGLNVEERFLIYYSMQLIRAYNCYFHVPTISDEEVRQLGFFERFESPQEVIDRGIKKLGRKATVAVFPHGGATFPIVE